MNQFNHIERNIKENIDQVFQEVQKEFIENYFVSGNGDFSNLQNELNHNLARKITNKKTLLVDTILNYLTDDAIKNLEGYENKVVNYFYTQNRNWQQEIKNKNNFQGSESNNSIRSLSDPRPPISAASGVAISVISALVLQPIFSMFMPQLELLMTISSAVLIGGSVAKLVYDNNEDAAMEKLKEAVMKDIEKSKAQVQEELKEIIKYYSNQFNHFLKEHQ